MFVPVVAQNQNPLMPTTLSRAIRTIKPKVYRTRREWETLSGQVGGGNHPFDLSLYIRESRKKECKWNVSFSLLKVGKQWFYYQLEKLGIVETALRSETKKLCSSLGLKKFKNKLAKIYSAHCLDSGVLANSSRGGHFQPDNTEMLIMIPLRFDPSQLHRLEHAPGHGKSRYDGTLSDGLKGVCLVKNPRYGLAYMGGFMDKPTKKNPDRK